MDKLYLDMYLSEVKEAQEAKQWPSIVKELVDCMVTAWAAHMFHSNELQRRVHAAWFYGTRDHLTTSGVNWSDALKAVNKSNFSKFVLQHEADDAVTFFEKQGIMIEVLPLSDGQYFGCYSACDQTVNGNDYLAHKLLKGPHYAPVDETKEWWL